MPLTCPACTKELSRNIDDLTSLEIDSCFFCHGLWFDYNELRRFFSAPKLYNKFRLPQHDFKVKINDPPPVRVCPRCDTLALTAITIEDVEVDECSGCKGIWLNSNEISRLIDLYQAGKLKGKCETVRQIKKGHFDRGALGQVSKTIGIALKMAFSAPK